MLSVILILTTCVITAYLWDTWAWVLDTYIRPPPYNHCLCLTFRILGYILRWSFFTVKSSFWQSTGSPQWLEGDWWTFILLRYVSPVSEITSTWCVSWVWRSLDFFIFYLFHYMAYEFFDGLAIAKAEENLAH